MTHKFFGSTFFLITVVAITAMAVVACGGGSADEPPTVVVPTLAAVADAPPTATATAVPLLPTNTPLPTITPTPSHTPTSVVQFAPTDTPIPTPTPTSDAPPPVELVERVTAGSVLASTLPQGQTDLYLMEMEKDATLYFVLRVVPELDISATIYAGDLLAELESGGDINTVLANGRIVRQTDSSGPGLPELVDYTARSAGSYTLVLRGVDSTSGLYRLYGFNSATESEHLAVAGPINVEESGSTAYNVASIGGKPVTVFAKPVGDANLRITIINASTGQIIIDANFGGPGSLEKAFVLPRATNEYTIEIREVSGAAAEAELIIVAIADPLQP